MRSRMWAAVGVLLISGCAAGSDTQDGQTVLPPGAVTAGPAPMMAPGGAAGMAPIAPLTPPTNTAGPAPGGMTPMTPPMTPPTSGGTSGTNGGAGAGPSPGPDAGTPMTPDTPVATTGDPTVPTVSGDCPAFRSGTISFMGLPGIRIEAGAKAAGPTAPMVFYWHGTGGSSGEFSLMAGAVHQGVVAAGGVLVSFQGTTGGDLLSGTAIFGAGDFELADQLVACAVRDHNVDPHKIFATGCSAGGLFSGAMAASRSNYMAAVAPNSGGWVLPVPFQNMYTPALMTIHGRPGGDVVVVDFSTTSKTADDAFKARGGVVINCNHGGGHCGGGGLAGDIWKFFQAHPYGVDNPWTSLPGGFHSSCMML